MIKKGHPESDNWKKISAIINKINDNKAVKEKIIQKTTPKKENPVGKTIENAARPKINAINF